MSAPYPNFDPNSGDPLAGFPGPPPMPSGNPGLDFGLPPMAESGYDPATDPVVQKLSSQKPLDLTIHLSEERQGKLARLICGEIDRWDRVVSRRFGSLDQWRRGFEMLPPGTANRWPGSSDVPSGLTRMYCNSHHTRLNQQILNATPPFTAVARIPAAKDAAPLIEDAMTAVLDNAEWNTVADDLHRELVIAGNVMLRVGWVQQYARAPQRQIRHDEEAGIAMLHATGDLHEAAWHSVEGAGFGHEDRLIYDGVQFKVIPFEDAVVCPPTVRDPEEAIGIGERLRIRGVDLLEGVERGWYFKEAVDDLLERPSDSEPPPRLRRKDEQGMLPDSGGYFGPEDRAYREYEVYELCWQYDADDDGKLEWIVVHLHKESRTILGLRWMEYEHGRPYYMLERYIRRTAELFGCGIPELIASYHDADTAVINQIQDHGDLNLNMSGNYIYTSLSGIDPEKEPLELGRPIKAESIGPNDFQQLQPMPLPAEQYQLSERYRMLCDLLTASSNPTLGRTADSGHTLGEVQLVSNAANSIFEDFAARVARDHARAWDLARWLTAQYGVMSEDGEVMYRRTAAPDMIEFKTIKPEDLKANVDLVPTGMTQLSDAGARIQQSTLIMSQLMNLLGTVQSWLPFAPVVLETFGQYMKDLKWPLRDKVLGLLEQSVQQLLMQQQMMQQAAMTQAAMAPSGPGGQTGPGPGGVPSAPPGTIGGAPAPIPGPPELPPGTTAVNSFPPPQVPL